MVNPGQTGEAVVTALNQYAMPFIRYKNGDIAVYETEVCPCQREIPVLREVVGRDCDLMVHSDGHVVHWSIIIVIMMRRNKIRQYQVYQPDLKNLEVRYVCQEEVKPGYLEEIRQDLQPVFGDSIQISFNAMNHIPLNAGGKYRHVISDVKPDSYN